jgi:hypothetical protein
MLRSCLVVPESATRTQPRSGDRMQPTAQAVGNLGRFERVPEGRQTLARNSLTILRRMPDIRIHTIDKEVKTDAD